MKAMLRGALLEAVGEFFKNLRTGGYRGLIVLHSSSLAEAASSLVGLSEARTSLVIASRDVREELKPKAGERVKLAGFMDVGRLLGSEYDLVVIAAEGHLRPNLVAAAGEMVRGGGALALVVPPLDRWNPGVVGGRGCYKAYLLNRLSEMRNLLWLDADAGLVKDFRTVGPAREARDGRALPATQFKSKKGVPKALSSLAANVEQALLLEEFARFVRGRGRCLAVIGDRGRGKSASLGLALALAVYWHVCGPVEVVAPDLHSVQSLMRFLVKGLEALGVKYKAVEKDGLIVRVQGPWFRIGYERPELARPGPLIVIDEAAAVGVARVRRLTWRSGKSVLATTIHGYEGSGRIFTKLLLEQLPKPVSLYELRFPVRYPPGDPLEAWIYDTFMLRAEPTEKATTGKPRYSVLDADLLARDRVLFGKVYSILVLAHYRNEPDDLMLMLDAPHHEVKALTEDGEPVAVAEISLEHARQPQAARLVLNKLAMYAPEASGSTGVRVVRIAVAPSLQRRGLGSRLLREIEEEASARGADWVGSIFSRHDVLEFWFKNGYRAFYVSPRFNRTTGEKNVAVIKPLSERASQIVEEAVRAFKWRLLVSAHSVYRDLAAEKLAMMLKHMDVSVKPPIGLSDEQLRRLEAYLRGEVEYESAHDAIYLATLRRLAESGVPPLPDGHLVAIVARVIQGKPLDEVSSIVGLPPERVAELVNEALRMMLDR